MQKLILLTFSFFFLFHSQAQKQVLTADGKKLDTRSINELVSKLMVKGEVTGLGISVINNNKPVFVKSYGYKNKYTKELNDTATCFYAASLAKPLFGVIVIQLVEAGKLNLDKPVYTYLPKPLPEYDDYKDLATDSRWKLITARHCLAHTTGFPNWREFNPNENNKLEFFFTPGERYAYSGEGIYLLQLVIETITGKKLDALAQEKIFQPFGMNRSSFLWQPNFENNFALGHNTNEDTLKKDKRVRASAAGSMETTLADYTKFLAALLNGKGMNDKSRQEMFSKQIGIYNKHQFPSLNTDTTNQNIAIDLGYGLGWGLFKTPYGKAYFKEGHGNGWQHYTVSIPDKKFSLLIMSNSANGESIFKELIETIAGISFPWVWEGYTPYRATIKLPTEVLQQYVGTYEGKLDGTITLVDGILKIESKTVNLPKTNIYPTNDHHFFLKIMETEMDFVKDADGKVDKILMNDEGEQYELKKVKPVAPAETNPKKKGKS